MDLTFFFYYVYIHSYFPNRILTSIMKSEVLMRIEASQIVHCLGSPLNRQNVTFIFVCKYFKHHVDNPST